MTEYTDQDYLDKASAHDVSGYYNVIQTLGNMWQIEYPISTNNGYLNIYLYGESINDEYYIQFSIGDVGSGEIRQNNIISTGESLYQDDYGHITGWCRLTYKSNKLIIETKRSNNTNYTKNIVNCPKFNKIVYRNEEATDFIITPSLEYTNQDYINYINRIYGTDPDTVINLGNSWSIECLDGQICTDNDCIVWLSDETMMNIVELNLNLMSASCYASYIIQDGDDVPNDPTTELDFTRYSYEYAKLTYRFNQISITLRQYNGENETHIINFPKFDKIIYMSDRLIDYNTGDNCATITPNINYSLAQDLVEIRNILANNLEEKGVQINISDGIRTLSNKIKNISPSPNTPLSNDTCLWYDKCDKKLNLLCYKESEKLVYGGDPITVMSYDTTENAYKLQGSGNWATFIEFIDFAMEEVSTQATLEMDIKTTANNWVCAVGFAIYEDDNTIPTWLIDGDGAARYQLRIKGNGQNGEWFQSLGTSNQNRWFKLVLNISNRQEVTYNIFDPSNNNVLSKSITLPSQIPTNSRLGIMHFTELGITNSTVYIKNIKVSSI